MSSQKQTQKKSGEEIPETAEKFLHCKDILQGVSINPIIFNSMRLYFIGFFGLLAVLSIYAWNDNEFFDISEYQNPIIYNFMMIVLMTSYYKTAKKGDRNYKETLTIKYIVLFSMPFFTFVHFELLTKNLDNFLEIIVLPDFEKLLHFFTETAIFYFIKIILPLVFFCSFFLNFLPQCFKPDNFAYACGISFLFIPAASVATWFILGPITYALICSTVIFSVVFQFVFFFIDLPFILFCELANVIQYVLS